jgi:hypothetical protein
MIASYAALRMLSLVVVVKFVSNIWRQCDQCGGEAANGGVKGEVEPIRFGVQGVGVVGVLVDEVVGYTAGTERPRPVGHLT